MRWRGNFIGGRFVKPSGGRPWLSEDPGDLAHPLGTVRGSAEAVERAVESAARARGRWAATSVPQRRRFLRRLQRVLRSRASDLTGVIAREVGKPRWEAAREVDRMIARVDETLTDAWARVRPYEVAAGAGVRGRCRYRPAGICAIIGPFNFPAHIPAGHWIPGLLAGNVVILKPSELAPFVGQAIADCVAAAGAPAGVFNLVQGGPAVGRRLVEHPAVNAVLFTGSAATGQRIRQAVLRQPAKRLALEMGGKNAALVLEDAEVPVAAREVVVGAFSMAGQRCNATSRVIVARRRLEEFLAALLPLVDGLRIGYPLAEGTFMGPLVSRAAVARYHWGLTEARRAGYARLRAGGRVEVPGYRGYYVRPSVHVCERPLPVPGTTGEGPRYRFAYRTTELFAPDLAVYAAGSLEEAVALNNDVPYGLVTSIFTRRRARFEAAAAGVDTGLVHWNRGTIGSSGRLPFGGTKASGNHAPAGLWAIDACVYPVATLEDHRPLAARERPPGLPGG